MKAKSTQYRILLVDDHPICRSGLAEIINSQKDLTVCGVAEDTHTALEQAENLKPDLMVIDISLKAGSGIELLKDVKVRTPRARVLMLSMHDENLYATRSLRAGAAGYVMKREAADNILTAIRKVLAGEVYLSAPMEKKLMQRLVGAREPAKAGAVEDLSDRELEVFNMIGDGKATRQIAEEMHLSIKTVESHRAHIKEKLNLRNAGELVQHAVHWKQAELGGFPVARN